MSAVVCGVRVSFLSLDLGGCSDAAVALLAVACEHECVREPLPVCREHLAVAQAPSAPGGLKVCALCEAAGRKDVPIRLVSIEPVSSVVEGVEA